MIRRKRLLTGGPVTKYILYDTFSDTRAAGAVNGTLATPLPGVRIVGTVAQRTRTAADTNSKINVGAGVLGFATGAAANDAIWYGSIARAAGRVLIGRLVASETTNGIPSIGWDSSAAGAILDALKLAASGVLSLIANGGAAVSIGTYTATTYDIAVVMRATGIDWFIKGGAFTNWTLLWKTVAGTGDGFPAIAAANTTAVFTADNLRIPSRLWLPAPIVSDGFGGTRTGLGSSDGLGHAEGVAVGLGAGGSGVAWMHDAGVWAVSGGVAAGTPTLGEELLTDPGLEDWASATNLTSWTETIAGTSTVNREASVIHSGTYALRIDADASSSAGNIAQTVAAAITGMWVQFSSWLRGSGAGTQGRMTSTNTTFAHQGRTPGNSAYVQYVETGRVSNSNPAFGIRHLAVSQSFYADDLSIKSITLSSTIAAQNISTPNYLVDVTITARTLGTQVGLCLNLDSQSTPANFILVYFDGAGNLKVDKCVAGVYTNLASTAVTWNAAQVLRCIKDGNSLDVFYNNAKIGSTIDLTGLTGIVNNTLVGLFSAFASNTFDNFTVYGRTGYDAVLNAM